MDINELKLGDLVTLQNLLKGNPDNNTITCHYKNQYVIVRSNGSGVHFGIVKSYNENTRTVVLIKSRRLWEWYGFTLSAVANQGMSNDKARVAEELPEILITEVLELIPCTEKAIKNLSEYKVHIPS